MKRVFLLHALFILATLAANAQDNPKMDTIVGHAARDFINDRSGVGFSAGVIKDVQTNIYNYGSTEKSKIQIPADQTLYEIGSITKTFTSILLAHALLEKKVKLDDDIRKYLRDSYPNLRYQDKPIQLLHLVNLTSGLPNNMPENPGDFKGIPPDSIPFALVKVRYTRENFLNDLHKVKLDTVPGLIPKHSNAAALLLTYILENIYHKPYSELVKEYITGPLQMSNTFVVVPQAKLRLLAKGYTGEGVQMPYIPGSAVVLKSCIADMTKYMQFQLEEKDAAVKMTHRIYWGNENVFALGMNWFIGKTGDGKLKIHDDGTTFGFTTYILLYPEQHFGVVLITNKYDQHSNDKLGELSDRIFNENYYTAAQIASDGFGYSYSVNHLLDQLNGRGFDQALQVVSELQKSDSRFKPDENELNNWAYSLLRKGKENQAFEIFKLNTFLYPQSWNVYDSYGEILLKMKQKDEAVKMYKKSVALNPNNENGKKVLTQLQKN